MDFLKRTEEEDNVLRKMEMDAVIIQNNLATGGQMVIRDPFDPAPLLKVFDNFHVQIDGMANKAMGVSVKSDTDVETATLLTTQAKSLTQAIEKERVRLKEPYLKVTSVLDFETKQLKDRLAKVQAHINGLISPYLQKKEQERREAEQKAKEEAARIQAELDEKARLEREQAAKEAREKAEAEGKSKAEAEAEAKQAAEMVEDAPQVVTEAPAETKVLTEAGSAKMEEEDSWEILDYRALPLPAFDLLHPHPIPNKPEWPHGWIRNQLKAGIRNIPGVRVFKVAKLKTRAKSRVSGRNAYGEGEW